MQKEGGKRREVSFGRIWSRAQHCEGRRGAHRKGRVLCSRLVGSGFTSSSHDERVVWVGGEGKGDAPVLVVESSWLEREENERGVQFVYFLASVRPGQAVEYENLRSSCVFGEVVVNFCALRKGLERGRETTRDRGAPRRALSPLSTRCLYPSSSPPSFLSPSSHIALLRVFGSSRYLPLVTLTS